MTSPPQLVDARGTAPDAAVGAAVRVLRAGGLVAFPTETVYGLGADATDGDALARVFTVKDRPATDPLIVHVADAAAAARVVDTWTDRAAALAARFWPGPLTLVLDRSAAVHGSVGGGRPTVAVRVPAHPLALALLEAVDRPVAAPSANRFGRISPTTAAHVLAEGLVGVDLVLDGGPCPLGVESTVLDLTGPVPVVLRPGGVLVEDLREVLGEVVAPDRQIEPESDPAAAPGRFLRHYAPTTPLVLVDGPPGTMAALAEHLGGAGVAVGTVALPSDPAAAARSLYAALRDADGTAQILLVAGLPGEGLGRAVNDRLFRAAAGRVVTEASSTTVERVCRMVVP